MQRLRLELLDFCGVPLPDRPWHRRRIRRDQFRDRRADPRAAAWSDRPDRQRQLLGRRGDRRRAPRCCCCPGASSASTLAGGSASASAPFSAASSCSSAASCPESPRWQITHGREQEAKQNTEEIERQVGQRLPPAQGTLKVRPRKVFGFGLILGAMLGENRGRSFLALTLMVAQAFLFNAVFFTYGLVLTNFYHVQEARAGVYILPLAVGNFLGPLLLGPFLRHDRAQEDDHRHLWTGRGDAGRGGGAVRHGSADRLDPDRLLDRCLLRRLRRRQFRLPHRQRNLSVGNAGRWPLRCSMPWAR